MKLTGKCLDAFGDQSEFQYEDFMQLPEVFQNALIIDFFDSVGIKIFPYPIINSEYFDAVILHENRYEAINVRLTRSQAINEAITKANTIYNHGKTS